MIEDTSLFFLWAVSAVTTLGMGWFAWWFLNKIHSINSEDDD